MRVCVCARARMITDVLTVLACNECDQGWLDDVWDVIVRHTAVQEAPSVEGLEDVLVSCLATLTAHACHSAPPATGSAAQQAAAAQGVCVRLSVVVLVAVVVSMPALVLWSYDA